MNIEDLLSSYQTVYLTLKDDFHTRNTSLFAKRCPHADGEGDAIFRIDSLSSIHYAPYGGPKGGRPMVEEWRWAQCAVLRIDSFHYAPYGGCVKMYIPSPL